MSSSRARWGAGLAIPLLAEVALRAALGGAPWPSRAAVTATAACVAAAALLLEPAAERHDRAGRPRGIWCLAAGAWAAALAALHARGAAPVDAVALSGAAAALLVFTLGSARHLAGAAAGSTGAALFLALLGLAIGAPIWGAPVLESAGGGGALDALVAASPISYLAAMAGHDYLHEQWFYTHSLAGSLRFTYPGRIAATAAWIVLALLVQTGERRLAAQRP